jgi:hypothetical protein
LWISAQFCDIRVLRRIRDFENRRFRRNDKVWNYGTVELHVNLGVLFKKKCNVTLIHLDKND